MTFANSVAIFASSFAPHVGGVEELSRRLALEQNRRGTDSFIVTNRYPKELPDREDIGGLDVNRVRFRFPEPRPRDLAGFAIGTSAARRACRDILRRHRADLVHVQCVSSNGYYALRVARNENLPLVVTLQGELTMDATHIYQRSATIRRMWRQLVSHADVVTGCSQQVVDEAIDFYGAELAAKCRVVRNGVDLEAVRAARPEVRPRPYILGIGRLVPQKGFDLLIGAFAQIAQQDPEVDLVLAGDGPEREALGLMAANSDFKDRIHLIGAVPAARAFSLYQGAIAFVLSSRHEPQGIVVIEAMAAKAPVLAASVGGVPETVADGTNGLLFEGGSAASLANGLRIILGDPGAAATRADQATRDVERYTWSQIADEYDSAYEAARQSWRARQT